MVYTSVILQKKKERKEEGMEGERDQDHVESRTHKFNFKFTLRVNIVVTLLTHNISSIRKCK